MKLFDFGPIAKYLGRGEASITVPMLDGAFRPNDFLEKAQVVAEHPGADCLAVDKGRLFLSAGDSVYPVGEEASDPVARFDDDVTALAINGDLVAVGLSNGGICIRGGDPENRVITEIAGRSINCPTALYFQGNRLIVANGSDRTQADDWSRDLLERNIGGDVLAIDLKSGAEEILASHLAYANGLTETSDHKIAVSQSWNHCVSILENQNIAATASRNLPGYPSRISKAPDGGYWLAIFGMRTQLIEFILREDSYRTQMLETVPPEYWVAPSLTSREHFMDPLQQGGVKRLGIKKPWAPPRSYGLAVKLDANFNPILSVHSRAGGLFHGVTSALERDGILYVTSRGAGQVRAVDLAIVEQETVK
ncbi:hypothetical protein [Sneathiella sp.]|uniref:hypothetical protein n=1 Tax=Sneathiella sp. TaxID=1964365 RepID=UPI00261DB01F|nr:hypothetical protein [Sneathiella sp.]MDF2367969.1 hypothetical protein [Sneathiella sp.]